MNASRLASGISVASFALLSVLVGVAAFDIRRQTLDALAGATVFALTPTSGFYGLTPTPEIPSSFLATAVLVAFSTRLCREETTSRDRWWLAIVILFAGTAAVLLRRDHVLLAAILPAFVALSAGSSKLSLDRAGLYAALAAGVFSALFLFAALNPSAAGMNELGSYASRFGPEYIPRALSQYLASLARPDWYGTLPILFIVGCFACPKSPRLLLWILAASAYLSLFVIFDHGFYFPKTGEISAEHLARYMSQATPAMSVVAGVGAGLIWDNLERHKGISTRQRRVSLALLCAALISVLTALGNQFVSVRRAEEQEYRLAPAAEAAAPIPDSGFVVAWEPIVFQLVSNGRLRTGDFATAGRLWDLRSAPQDTAADDSVVFYYSMGECEERNASRYADQCRWISNRINQASRVERIQIGHDRDLFRLTITADSTTDPGDPQHTPAGAAR